MITDFSSVTKAATQRERNLTNMCHLFHRGTDERGQAFPSRLANNSQTAAKAPSRVHCRVIREGRADFCQWMIKREITRDGLAKTRRLKVVGRSTTYDFQAVSTLLDVNSHIANRAHKSLAHVLPVKDLAGIECHR